MAEVTIDQLTPRQPTTAAIIPFMNSSAIEANNATGGQASSLAFPAGFIAMWSGNTVPGGWYLCNGANGTPDLRNQFIIGSLQDSGGQSVTTVTGSNTKTGGSADAVNIAHTHTGSTSHTHSGSVASVSLAGGGAPNGGVSATTYASLNAGLTSSEAPALSIDSQGSSGTNANLPPYYALAYIMKA
jgi:microcystin-dependent protein